jgi:hypothetical protein
LNGTGVSDPIENLLANFRLFDQPVHYFAPPNIEPVTVRRPVHEWRHPRSGFHSGIELIAMIGHRSS